MIILNLFSGMGCDIMAHSRTNLPPITKVYHAVLYIQRKVIIGVQHHQDLCCRQSIQLVKLHPHQRCRFDVLN